MLHDKLLRTEPRATQFLNSMSFAEVIADGTQQSKGILLMKELFSVIALMAVWLSGCGGGSTAGSSDAVTIDCAVEIQIAVVSGRKPGDTINEGDWRVAAACVLPVRSTGGPGHVVSSTDGAVIELQWSDVLMIHGGKMIAFSDCEWRLRNRVNRRDGVSHGFGGRLLNNTRNFGKEFEWISSVEIDTTLSDKTLREQSDRSLVIRGRLLPEAPPAEPLDLAALTGLAP